ncbi:MAG: hypothetical protein QW496_06545, partial [Desulfurococcaceae archaeon]
MFSFTVLPASLRGVSFRRLTSCQVCSVARDPGLRVSARCLVGALSAFRYNKTRCTIYFLGGVFWK